MKGEEQSKPSNDDGEDEDTTADASDGPTESKGTLKATQVVHRDAFEEPPSFDLWFIFLGLFIICIAEGRQVGSNRPMDFTSSKYYSRLLCAYGTVGLSLGYAGSNTSSFTGQFTPISKLVIIAMMIRGRHRGRAITQR